MAQNMRDWLAMRADVTPRDCALSNGKIQQSFSEVNERIETVAGKLAATGVGVGDSVVVQLNTSVEFFELVHAIQRLGAILVPLSTRLTVSEVSSRLDKIDTTTVITATGKSSLAKAFTRLQIDHATLLTLDQGQEFGSPLTSISPCAFNLPEWEKDDPMIIMFTSGTTGESKGVVLTFGNVLASATASAFRLELTESDVWHVCLPMYHMGGLAPIYRSVLYGTTVSIQEGADPETTLDQLAEQNATCISLVPTMLERLLEISAKNEIRPLQELRFVLLGGAPCPIELLQRAHSCNIPVSTTYGMTEAASQICTARPEETEQQPGTVGSPLMFANVSILDESDTPCQPNEEGEIVVSGPMISPGYLDQATTKMAFDTHGLRTGDLGYRDENGHLWIIGRVSDRIITGGENVDPEEVIDVLRSHPSVSDAAVLGVPDPDWGEAVAALIESEDNLTVESVKKHCRSELAGFKVPSIISFIDTLPRTASGTIDRTAVKELLHPEDV